MANIYEQFDPLPQTGERNVYEQFDTASPAGEPTARITVRPPGRSTSLNPFEIYPELVRGGLAAMRTGSEQAAGGFERYATAPSELERAIQGIQEGKDIDYAVQGAQQAPMRERSLVPVPISQRLAAVQDILGGFGKTLAGAGEYTTAPLVAPFRSVVSQPLENVTGLPREYSEFAATLAAPIPKRIPGLAAAPESFIPTRPIAPTEAQLRSAGSAGYQAPEVVGAPIRPPTAAAQLADQIRFDLTRGRVSDVRAGDVPALINEMRSVPGGVSLERIETLRQQLGEISPVKDATGAVTNRPELRAAAIARGRIDQFIRESFPEAAPTLERARGDISAAESAATFSRAQLKAELREARTGRPVSSSMLAQMESILTNPNQRRGFSQGELAMMEGMIRGGGPLQRGARAVERFSREEKFISPVTRPLIGFPLRKLGEYLTARDIDRLNEVIRSDSPLGRQMTTPLADWSRASEAFAGAPTARNRARLTIASRNLSNNLADAGVVIPPDRLITAPRTVPASKENGEQ